MAGIDRFTGKMLAGWPHVVQSLGVIFSTGIGSRIMRRAFGSNVQSLLGKNLTAPTLLRLKTAIIVAVELWEPRFSIDIAVDEDANTIDNLRQGELSLVITGTYRPRGHLGDPTPETGSYAVRLSGANATVTSL